jgi:hypothetical protein
MMPEAILFEIVHEYLTTETGIALPAILRSGDDEVLVRSKLDTGAAFCIF